jgi:Raf kinase inhibitor-like YbhB/YbcL family protein
LEDSMTFRLTSPSFMNEHEIPVRHTADGADISPALAWTEPPAGTRTFALVVDDPDAPDPRAPTRTWVHWVLYRIPSGTRALPEGAQATLPIGTVEGLNDWQRVGWRGPSPPIGKHRYFFRLFALDTALAELGTGASKPELIEAMAGHVLATATLMGTYQRFGPER